MRDNNWNLLCMAWAVAIVATLGALFIGEVLGKIPCNLCWYQRIFMFPLAAILGIATYRSDFGVWRYALPLSLSGLAVAVFHSLLFYKILPEAVKPCMAVGPSCSGADMMLWGALPLPLLSVAAFTFISINLFILVKRTSK